MNTLLDAARDIYDRWARSLSAKDEWQQAADVYAEALKRYPDDSHLTNNAAVTWNSWASKHMDKQDWAAAIKVYERGVKALPSASLLKNNLKYCQQQGEQ